MTSTSWTHTVATPNSPLGRYSPPAAAHPTPPPPTCSSTPYIHNLLYYSSYEKVAQNSAVLATYVATRDSYKSLYSQITTLVIL